ncbi:hypothetical protein [Natrinema amylolyticum]|uniref:hypothetical protein n=1 Tax=Natrinema amylolyticum TaxID=2878679 RepID=UPI001CFB55FC|nr:hypothetical protein [Natrinema amylolyticum]
MESTIVNENDEGIAVDATDNNDILHELSLEKGSWKIVYHQQDGYADDPTLRTKEETEHGNQARWLAKWHVYRERGYDTLTPYENPDRILATILALLELPDVMIDHYFGDLQAKLRNHQNGSSVDLPFDDADPDDIIVYRKDVWLEPDPTDADPPLLEQFCEYVSDPLDTLEDILGDGPDPRESMPNYEIEAVSDIHYLHSDGLTRQTHWNDQPLEREPDARIELMPVDTDVFDSFQTFLASHLAHQIRDCYLLMGCEPPEPFQTRGLGKHDAMVKQQLMDMYDVYYVVNESINGI